MKKFIIFVAAMAVLASPAANAQSALEKMKQKAMDKVNSAVNSAMSKVGDTMTSKGDKTGLGSILKETAEANKDEHDAYDVQWNPGRFTSALDSAATIKRGIIKKAGAIFASVPKGTPSYPGMTDEQMAAYLRALDQAEFDLAATMSDLNRRCGAISVDMEKIQQETQQNIDRQQQISAQQQATMNGTSNQAKMVDLSQRMFACILTDAEMKQMQEGKFTPNELDIKKRTAAILNMSVEEYDGMEAKARGMNEVEQKAYYEQIRKNATPKGQEFLDITMQMSKLAPKVSGSGMSEYEQIKMKLIQMMSETMTNSLAGLGGGLNMKSLIAGIGEDSSNDYFLADDGYTYTTLEGELRSQIGPKYIAYFKALEEWNFPDITLQRQETWIGKMYDTDRNYIYKQADRPDLSKKKAVEESYRELEPAISAIIGKYSARWSKLISDADAAFKKANGNVNADYVALLNKALKHKDCPETDKMMWQQQLLSIELEPLQALQDVISKRRDFVNAVLYYPEFQDHIELTGIKYNDFRYVYSKTGDYLVSGKFPEGVGYVAAMGSAYYRGIDRNSPLIGKTSKEILDAVKPCQITYKNMMEGGNFDVIFGDGYQFVKNIFFDCKNNVSYSKYIDNTRFSKKVYGKEGVENDFNNLRIKELSNYFEYFGNGCYHSDALCGQIREVGVKIDTNAMVAGRACSVYAFSMDANFISKESIGDGIDYIYVDNQTGAVLKQEDGNASGSRSVRFEAISVKNGAPALSMDLIRSKLGITSANTAYWANGCGRQISYQTTWDAEAWKVMMGVQGWADSVPAYSGSGFIAKSQFNFNDDSASIEVHGSSEADAKAYAAKLAAAGYAGGEWSKSNRSGTLEWSANYDGGEEHSISVCIQVGKAGDSFIITFNFGGKPKPWINYV